VARKTNRLNKREIAKLVKARKRGRYPDGEGLHLQISKTGAMSWILIYRATRVSDKKGRRTMGLGSLRLVSLDDARKRRDEAHKL
jgi:hypothetical protein